MLKTHLFLALSKFVYLFLSETPDAALFVATLSETLRHPSNMYFEFRVLEIALQQGICHQAFAAPIEYMSLRSVWVCVCACVLHFFLSRCVSICMINLTLEQSAKFLRKKCLCFH